MIQFDSLTALYCHKSKEMSTVFSHRKNANIRKMIRLYNKISPYTTHNYINFTVDNVKLFVIKIRNSKVLGRAHIALAMLKKCGYLLVTLVFASSLRRSMLLSRPASFPMFGKIHALSHYCHPVKIQKATAHSVHFLCFHPVAN